MTFFRYFPTKEDVVLDDPYDPVLAQAVGIQAVDLPALERVRRGLVDSLQRIDSAAFDRESGSGYAWRPPSRRCERGCGRTCNGRRTRSSRFLSRRGSTDHRGRGRRGMPGRDDVGPARLGRGRRGRGARPRGASSARARRAGGAAVTGLSGRALVRRFGPVTAVDGVDLDVRPGEVHALVGLNGSGKTTLMRMLAGVLRPDSGEVRIGGVVAGPGLFGRTVGHLIDVPAAYPELTVAENLRAAGLLRDIPSLGSTRRCARPPWPSDSATSCIAARAACRWATVSASGWPRRWCTVPPSSCSTNRPTGSTRRACSPCAACCSSGRDTTAWVCWCPATTSTSWPGSPIGSPCCTGACRRPAPARWRGPRGQALRHARRRRRPRRRRADRAAAPEASS